jgi:hypothetical protein
MEFFSDSTGYPVATWMSRASLLVSILPWRNVRSSKNAGRRRERERYKCSLFLSTIAIAIACNRRCDTPNAVFPTKRAWRPREELDEARARECVQMINRRVCIIAEAYYARGQWKY